MKKHLFATAILLAAFSLGASAQLQRGNVLIGGNIAGFDLGLNSGSTFNMTLTPKVAWFTATNTALGAYADLNLATAKNAGTNFNWGLGALARYYFPSAEVNVARSTRFLLEANAGLQGVNTAGGNSTNGLGLGIGPGLAYFFNENISLESLLKYNGIVGFGSSASSSRLQLNIGVQIYLPGSRVRSEVNKIRQ